MYSLPPSPPDGPSAHFSLGGLSGHSLVSALWPPASQESLLTFPGPSCPGGSQPPPSRPRPGVCPVGIWTPLDTVGQLSAGLGPGPVWPFWALGPACDTVTRASVLPAPSTRASLAAPPDARAGLFTPESRGQSVRPSGLRQGDHPLSCAFTGWLDITDHVRGAGQGGPLPPWCG